jgi:hypothetical protein
MEGAMTLAKGAVGILLVAWSISAVAEERAAGMILAEGGLARAAIVVDPGASAVQRHAAAELARFLDQITGAQFAPVCRTNADRACLLVGPQAAKRANADFSTEGLGTDGIVIRPVEDDLILAGFWPSCTGTPRGTETLIDEFLAGYYGPAAPQVKAYLDVTHNGIERIAHDASPTPQQCDVPKMTMPDVIEASNRWLGCFADYTCDFLTFDVLRRGLAHLEAAEAAVQDDPELRLRVQVAQLPARHVFMMRWNKMREQARAGCSDWPMPGSIQEAFDNFIERADRANVTCFNRAILESAVRRTSASESARN